jgi:hypothetical protein
MNTKLLISAGIVTGTLAFGAPALAGEVTGGGPDGQKSTPIQRYEAGGSECAFSGLEDGDGSGVGPGVTQTWGGALLSETDGGRDVAFAAREGILQSFGPGQNCRGFASGD